MALCNLALIKFSGARANDLSDPTNAVGANHFGFQVDDLKEMQERIEKAGGVFFFDLGDERKGNFERKMKDPDGIIFDISYCGWVGTDGRTNPKSEQAESPDRTGRHRGGGVIPALSACPEDSLTPRRATAKVITLTLRHKRRVGLGAAANAGMTCSTNRSIDRSVSASERSPSENFTAQ